MPHIKVSKRESPARPRVAEEAVDGIDGDRCVGAWRVLRRMQMYILELLDLVCRTTSNALLRACCVQSPWSAADPTVHRDQIRARSIFVRDCFKAFSHRLESMDGSRWHQVRVEARLVPTMCACVENLRARQASERKWVHWPSWISRRRAHIAGRHEMVANDKRHDGAKQGLEVIPRAWWPSHRRSSCTSWDC